MTAALAHDTRLRMELDVTPDGFAPEAVDPAYIGTLVTYCVTEYPVFSVRVERKRVVLVMAVPDDVTPQAMRARRDEVHVALTKLTADYMEQRQRHSAEFIATLEHGAYAAQEAKLTLYLVEHFGDCVDENDTPAEAAIKLLEHFRHAAYLNDA